MATNMVDKGLYAAPTGLAVSAGEPDLEIDIVNPESVTLSDGSMEITLMPEGPADMEDVPFDANLAEYLDEGELAALSSEIVELVDADISARKDWADT
jgi:hypothetical protein